MGQLNVRIMTFPAMPVASAYAHAKDLNNHAGWLSATYLSVHAFNRTVYSLH
ncbi:hypothetical protein AK973_4103 [Pseudomonas brassicacearum]|nr:hypothetical protein AK973_4103 [Pseudomonas brassicacearum]